MNMEFLRSDNGALMGTSIQSSCGEALIDHRSGKVRDIYDLGDGRVVIVTTDRISCFDVVMANGIPDKGWLLTQISNFWFDAFGGIVGHHRLATDVNEFPEPFCNHANELAGRAMLVKKTKVIPVECVVRGYITGSGWRSYKKYGTVCGINLRLGLKQCEELPHPLFTPATKAEQGEHDENISFEQCQQIIGTEPADFIKKKSIEIFNKASRHARSRGIILADTKFEFGYELRKDGTPSQRIILIDEVLTPDSSRFWPADKYEAGRDQESFDKQFVRNHLESIGFDKDGNGVELPDDIVQKTRDKYMQAHSMLTGQSLPNFS